MIYKDLLSGESTGVDSVYDIDAIQNSISNILTTRLGSVPGRPNFGSNLHMIVFDQIDPITEKLAERYVRESLAKFEDRIIVSNVEVSKNEAFNRIIINISFSYVDIIGKTDSVSIPLSI